MRYLILVLLLLTSPVNGQTAEAPKVVPAGEEFTIKVGQQVAIKDTNLIIKFLRVGEDSRCPIDVVCVWAGNARLDVELRLSKKKKTTVALNTTLLPREGQVKNFKVQLVRLSPGRRQDVPVPPTDYEATLVVARP